MANVYLVYVKYQNCEDRKLLKIFSSHTKAKEFVKNRTKTLMYQPYDILHWYGAERLTIEPHEVE